MEIYISNTLRAEIRLRIRLQHFINFLYYNINNTFIQYQILKQRYGNCFFYIASSFCSYLGSSAVRLGEGNKHIYQTPLLASWSPSLRYLNLKNVMEFYFFKICESKTGHSGIVYVTLQRDLPHCWLYEVRMPQDSKSNLLSKACKSLQFIYLKIVTSAKVRVRT